MTAGSQPGSRAGSKDLQANLNVADRTATASGRADRGYRRPPCSRAWVDDQYAGSPGATRAGAACRSRLGRVGESQAIHSGAAPKGGGDGHRLQRSLHVLDPYGAGSSPSQRLPQCRHNGAPRWPSTIADSMPESRLVMCSCGSLPPADGCASRDPVGGNVTSTTRPPGHILDHPGGRVPASSMTSAAPFGDGQQGETLLLRGAPTTSSRARRGRGRAGHPVGGRRRSPGAGADRRILIAGSRDGMMAARTTCRGDSRRRCRMSMAVRPAQIVLPRVSSFSAVSNLRPGGVAVRARGTGSPRCAPAAAPWVRSRRDAGDTGPDEHSSSTSRTLPAPLARSEGRPERCRGVRLTPSYSKTRRARRCRSGTR